MFQSNPEWAKLCHEHDQVRLGHRPARGWDLRLADHPLLRLHLLRRDLLLFLRIQEPRKEIRNESKFWRIVELLLILGFVFNVFDANNFVLVSSSRVRLTRFKGIKNNLTSLIFLYLLKIIQKNRTILLLYKNLDSYKKMIFKSPQMCGALF